MKGAVEKFCAVAERLNPLIWAIAVIAGVAGVIWVVKRGFASSNQLRSEQEER